MFNIDKKQVLAAFDYRSACRNYDPNKKISQQDMEYILELARLSPSSVGAEPWKFLVLQNAELREKIHPFAWGIKHPIQQASHLVIILAKKNVRYDSEFLRQSLSKRGLDEQQMENAIARYQQFQQNDINILDSERSLFDWCSKQTYIALANMMTGAALIGIDSCPIEGFNYAKVNQILADEGLFDLNEYGISCMVTFGYRAKDINKKHRKPAQEVIQWIE